MEIAHVSLQWREGAVLSADHDTVRLVAAGTGSEICPAARDVVLFEFARLADASAEEIKTFASRYGMLTGRASEPISEWRELSTFVAATLQQIRDRANTPSDHGAFDNLDLIERIDTGRLRVQFGHGDLEVVPPDLETTLLLYLYKADKAPGGIGRCAYCGNEFIRPTRRAEYCSESHRTYAHRAKAKGATS